MDEKYKYDVAFSCAEEDLPIAQQIAASLKEVNIPYYLYTEHSAEDWGENIFRISMEKYGAEARFVLMLISEHYIKKHWSDIEKQIAETVVREGEAYILPLRLDNTEVKGLNSNIKYEKWANNPKHIAELIFKKVEIPIRDSISGISPSKMAYNIRNNITNSISATTITGLTINNNIYGRGN